MVVLGYDVVSFVSFLSFAFFAPIYRLHVAFAFYVSSRVIQRLCQFVVLMLELNCPCADAFCICFYVYAQVYSSATNIVQASALDAIENQLIEHLLRAVILFRRSAAFQ